MNNKLLTKQCLAEMLGVSLGTLRKYLKNTPGIDYDKIKKCKVIPPVESKLIMVYYELF